MEGSHLGFTGMKGADNDLKSMNLTRVFDLKSNLQIENDFNLLD